MGAALAFFYLGSADWTWSKFRNWLKKTDYGMYSAIDIFVTYPVVPKKVINQMNDVNYRCDKVADPKNETIMNTINTYSDMAVGLNQEKIFLRLQHLSEIFTETGEYVKKRQLIGLTAHMGLKASVGDHLHFEIRLNPTVLGPLFNDDILTSIAVNPYYCLLEIWTPI